MEFPLKAILESVFIGAISTLLAMLLFFIPILNIAVLLFPIPLIIVGVRRGIWAGVLGLLVSSALLALLIHPFLGLMIFILNVFLIVGLSWAFIKRMEMNECIILSATGILVSVLLSFQAFTWMVGKSFFDFLWDNLEKFFTANSANLTAILELYSKWGVLDKTYSVERFAELLIGQMRGLMPLFPSVLLIVSLALGGVSFLMARLILKRFQLYTPYVPSFGEWNLPRGTGRGFFIIMLIAMVGTFMQIQNFDVVLYTISSLFSFVFAIQGLAVVDFLLKGRKLPGAVRGLILIIAFIFISMALTVLGLFEQIFHFRRAYSNRTRG